MSSSTSEEDYKHLKSFMIFTKYLIWANVSLSEYQFLCVSIAHCFCNQCCGSGLNISLLNFWTQFRLVEQYVDCDRANKMKAQKT